MVVALGMIMVLGCIEIERIGKFWKKTRVWSGYYETLKRKADVLEAHAVALATSPGELSPVLLISPVRPAKRPVLKWKCTSESS